MLDDVEACGDALNDDVSKSVMKRIPSDHWWQPGLPPTLAVLTIV
jgi:hypothetical protein